jgi:hypothetical protein
MRGETKTQFLFEKTITILTIGVLAIALPVSALSATKKASLESLRNILDRSLRKIEREYSSLGQRTAYDKSLVARAEEFKAEGDLESLLAINKERERLKNERTVPSLSEENLPGAVVEVRAAYHKRVAETSLAKSRKVVSLANNYVKRLRTMQSRLTREGNLEEAIKVRTEIDRVQGSSDVSAARFVVDAAVADAAPVDQTRRVRPGRTTEVPVDKVKVLKGRRKVPAKGDIKADWTRTTMFLKPGDRVSISAKGQWKLPRITAPCGPEGRQEDDYHRGNPTRFVRKFRNGRYYTEPQARKDPNRDRQDPKITYGALLYRIGRNGEPKLAGRSIKFMAEDTGPLFLDANILTGRKHRGKCSGHMMVEFEVERGEK